MNYTQKKFVDAEGLQHFAEKLNEYPNNEVLATVINAIEEEIPEVPVQDVQINGTSIVQDGVANVPFAVNRGVAGIVKVNQSLGITEALGTLTLSEPNLATIKPGGNGYYAISPKHQHEAAFYGLAKAAGADMKDIANTTVGTYPDAQKAAIQHMLGTDTIIAPEENDLIASKAYAIGEPFMANGKLYKATAAIAATETIIVEGASANAEETSVEETFVKKTDIATSSNLGVVKTAGMGIAVNPNNGEIYTVKATGAQAKAGTANFTPLVPSVQHESVFYGLSKVAGVDLANETVTLGTYPETSKAAIRSMLGASSINIIAVQDTQPTDTDTKIWLPETAGTPVEVPTVTEMNTALAGKVGDVQVNGTSVVTNGVATVPIASTSGLGVCKFDTSYGLNVYANGIVRIWGAASNTIKNGTNENQAVAVNKQHESVFYGLAKAAGDTTQSASSNAVGTYTDNAKASIKSMLGIVDGSTGTVSVTGTTPTITAVENTRYVCGEVSTLSFTPPASGISIVRFTSGTTATVLTLPNTVIFPEWFDATALEANTIYEMCITDGIYGAVMSWAQ